MVKYGKQIYTVSKHLQVVGCSDEAAYEQIVVTVHLTSASCLNRPWKMELTSCWRTQQISTRRSRWDDMNVPRTSLGRSAHHWCYVKELSSDPNDNRCLSYFITVCMWVILVIVMIMIIIAIIILVLILIRILPVHRSVHRFSRTTVDSGKSSH